MNDTELSDGDKKVFSDIEKYGLHVIYVLEDDEGPGFGFSIGLYKNYGHPEIIIIGLKQELTHSIINDIGAYVKDGKKYESLNYYDGLIKGFECYFVDIDKSNYYQYMGYANWYYGDNDFPVVQCIYPTIKGIYPWQKEWPENIKDLQPLLGQINEPK